MKVTFEFTDDELRWILVTAQESGSGYWAVTDRDIPDVLSGHVVRFWDREAYVRDLDSPSGVDEARSTLLGTLTPEMVRGVGAKLQGKFHASILAQFLDDPASADATAADCLLQVALFGEVVYG